MHFLKFTIFSFKRNVLSPLSLYHQDHMRLPMKKLVILNLDLQLPPWKNCCIWACLWIHCFGWVIISSKGIVIYIVEIPLSLSRISLRTVSVFAVIRQHPLSLINRKALQQTKGFVVHDSKLLVQCVFSILAHTWNG